MKARLVAGIILLVFLASVFLLMNVVQSRTEKTASHPNTTIALSDGQLFLPQSLMQDIEPAQLPAFDSADLISGIVPHHLPFSAGMLKGFFKVLGEEVSGIKTVLILSVNHYEAQNNEIKTACIEYKTSLGKTSCDGDLVFQLLSTDLVKEDRQVFETEHAIYAEIPFIETYLSNVKVVPLIFGQAGSAQTADKLGKYLADNLTEDVFVVLSTDLSHRLPYSEALKMDEKTISYMLQNRWAELDESNYDAGFAGVAFASYLKSRGGTTGIELARGNAGDFGGPKDETTGYVTVVYPKN